MRLRLKAISSRQCASQKNKYHCPEIFLDVVSSKLTSTAVLFLNVELLSEFYYNFPRELDVRLGKGLSREEVERFAREDEKVRGHLDVVRRKELLELCLEKMEGVRALDREEKRGRGKTEGRKRERAKTASWSLF